MKSCLALIFTFMFVTIGIGQDQEYAITLKNDTINGKVSIYQNEGMGQQIVVKNGKQKTNFKIHEVKIVLTKKGELHTLNIRNMYQLAKLEKAGYLSYYKFSGNPNSPSLSFDTPLLMKKTKEQIEIPNIGFRKQVLDFLSDCENVRVKFENGTYKKKDLLQIIDDYNECIEDNTQTMNNKFADLSQKTSQADKIKGIKEALNNASSINDKEQIIEMLDDVQAKLQAGEQVPGYLIGALKEKLSSAPNLLENLLQIVQ